MEELNTLESIRKQVNAGSVKLEYCRTEDIVADILQRTS